MTSRVWWLISSSVLACAILGIGWTNYHRSLTRRQIAQAILGWGAGTAGFLWGIWLVTQAWRRLHPSPFPSPDKRNPVALRAYLDWYEHITGNMLLGLLGLLLVVVMASLGFRGLLSARRNR